jgi:membrane-associated protease RseP (regulator of RpoE activity)
VSDTLSTYLIVWRTIALRDREVIDALVDPAHAGPSPALSAALARWPGRYYWSREVDGQHLVLTRPSEPRVSEAWWLHVALLFATLFCTTYAGAVFQNTLGPSISEFVAHLRSPDFEFLRSLAPGLAFSLPLIAILLAHELGHFFTARRYQLDTSPPYFIPVPIYPYFIGTMGAFIRLRTILSDRRQLLDVGIAGPIAGFLVAVPALWYGFAHSTAADPGYSGMMVSLGWPVQLGESLITLALREVAGVGNQALNLHPVGFAGWFGIFVTMLNLLPISQLDGSHIFYSAAPRWHHRAAILFWLVLGVLGFFYWEGWGIWAVLIIVLSRGRLGHPPVLDSYRPLPTSRRWLAVVALVLFVITFSPLPFVPMSR